MSQTWAAVILASIGVITTMAGAALYILPGPAAPVLTVGIALLVTGIALLGTDTSRR